MLAMLIGFIVVIQNNTASGMIYEAATAKFVTGQLLDRNMRYLRIMLYGVDTYTLIELK